ncbi:trans-sulfuration enzyme family protein [Marinithermus hydrothermalis]|uniref:Cystathionine beta-lyase n=1 Tax=Marinithermus hydrothermalis (strain DSM 14884 / JCM 11576 / T1) TaxID=869210 RepID=F2NKG2_MARHT|nr:PLP-dependent aspartate aminotransferase family protein [Marinithermus hydrothermalis]AEB12622.1 Cystathionine beta-lyase [Marinithermus hydrothermalis DSM 14884]
MDPWTALLHEPPLTPHREVVPPIYQNSLFTFESVEAFETAIQTGDRHVYTRGTNPTVRLFEEKIAALEGAEDAVAFASGMGAIAAAVLSVLEAGDTLVVATPVYTNAHNFFTRILSRFGVRVVFVPGRDTPAVLEALKGARALYMESPAFFTLEVLDLEPLVAAAREAGAVTLLDSTWNAGYALNPHAWGVDLVVHSATKYFSGHADVVAGVVTGAKAPIARIRRREYALLGATLSPMHAWLLLRGLRTLRVRLKAHEEGALKVARFLEAHPKVRRVHHPLLPSHPQHALAKKYLKGASGLFTIELESEAAARAFCNALELFKIGVSWGGFESLVFPACCTPLLTQTYGISPGAVRLHVGLEPPEALIADLEQALARL